MPENECDSNDDCVDQLACVSGTCVNPCDKLPCGVNAYCEAQKHAAWCRCNVGFTELPGGECVSGEFWHYLAETFSHKKQWTK